MDRHWSNWRHVCQHNCSCERYKHTLSGVSVYGHDTYCLILHLFCLWNCISLRKLRVSSTSPFEVYFYFYFLQWCGNHVFSILPNYQLYTEGERANIYKTLKIRFQPGSKHIRSITCSFFLLLMLLLYLVKLVQRKGHTKRKRLKTTGVVHWAPYPLVRTACETIITEQWLSPLAHFS